MPPQGQLQTLRESLTPLNAGWFVAFASWAEGSTSERTRCRIRLLRRPLHTPLATKSSKPSRAVTCSGRGDDGLAMGDVPR